LFVGAPKVLLDPSLSEVSAIVGEPYRIRVPFKGSPVPTASWFNVSPTLLFNLVSWSL